ncbi:MAG: class I SAM-dependent methyltransferase [Myxococcota bacterium]
MSAPFTGERLHAEATGFGLDLARHQAAYDWAAARGLTAPILEMGSGSGHGSPRLRDEGADVYAIDRVAPDAAARASATRFVRGDLLALPCPDAHFATVVSFQVIEHFQDPHPYLDEMRRVLHPGGVALISTPNVARSDGVNPYHFHEYTEAELRALLEHHFAAVEILGVGVSAAANKVLQARSARIRTVMRLDPLALRDRLPRAWVESLFAWGARLVRAWGSEHRSTESFGVEDFPIGPPDAETSLDWIAVCREPRPVRQTV